MTQTHVRITGVLVVQFLNATPGRARFARFVQTNAFDKRASYLFCLLHVSFYHNRSKSKPNPSKGWVSHVPEGRCEIPWPQLPENGAGQLD